MSEKYIRENRNSYVISKSSKSYGKFQSMDDAIFARDLLVENDWDLDSIDEVQKVDDTYVITAVIDEKLYVIARFRKEPDDETIQRLIKKRMRNPNYSRYGLNITRVFDTFVIKKRIAGDDYVFGYYGSLADAEFVRNHLLENQWNINSFSQIMHDAENKNYKITEIICDKVYVLDTFTSIDEIDLDRVHEEFLTKISKHKLGLACYPHLDELTGEIPTLEERFNVKVHDDSWNLEDASDPMVDIIFTLTPWQKTVYDAVNDSTIEEIEKSLQRYRSKNFTRKIEKNLDELIEMNLISKNQEVYIKRNP